MPGKEMTIDLRRKKYGELLSYLPRLSLRSLACVLVISVMFVQVMNLGAFEAHVVNVTARIINDISEITPDGGQFCDIDGADITITTASDLGAISSIIYTLDGSDPTCPDDSLNEFTYTGPFHLIASSTVKARTCHDGKQSVIAEEFFDISPEYCPQICGNGVKEPPEECDGADGVPPGYSCTAECSLKEQSCEFDLDVMMILDRSGSMSYDGAPSSCQWWEKKLIGLSYQWVQNTTVNVTQEFCDAKNLPGRPSVFTSAVLNKIEQAKISANLFLDNLKPNDQSGLVSYANTAALDKTLSNDHNGTKAAINNMAPLGATNIGDAISLSNSELVSARANPAAHKIAILLTDGMANKPSGPGYGEYPADVAYAISKANDAAAAGIQIFTIGLGTGINQNMLKEIASTTNGNYHFAPTADQLQVIFENIISEFCDFGRISGCKYIDHDNDGQIAGEETLPGWEILLSNGLATTTQLTGADGCYQFSGLPAGSYIVSEGANAAQSPFAETYPEGKYYNISLDSGEFAKNKDFGNYFPRCGNGRLDGDYGEVCDDGNTVGGDGCSADCLATTVCAPTPETCDGLDNDCDGLTDNNIFIDKIASATPAKVFLADSTEVSDRVAQSDNIYAEQSVATVNYIYLQWYFNDLPSGASTTIADLQLEHREQKVGLRVQYKQFGNSWVDACIPTKSAVDKIASCNLLPLISDTSLAGDVNLRLRLACLDGSECREYLDWAKLTIGYREPVICPACGDGIMEGYEQCDDGNLNNNDGCSASCQIEKEKCLKINEVYYNPDDARGNINNQWIEFYNNCDETVDLANWSMENAGGAENKIVIAQNYPILPHQFAVVAANEETWAYWPEIPSEAIKISFGTTTLFNGGLNDPGDRINLFDQDGYLMDAVSWGADNSAFDPAVPGVIPGHSISRKPAGFDTDAHSDWIDTYSGSTPPGPNPGTNPHDGDGNLLAPRSLGEVGLVPSDNFVLVEGDSGAQTPNISDAPATLPTAPDENDENKTEIIIIDNTAVVPDTSAIIDDLPVETPIAGG